MQKLLILALALVSVTLADWAIYDPHIAEIAMTCDFQSETDGWVGGATAALQPLLLHTTNGASSFNNSMLNKNEAILALDFLDPDGKYAVAAGLGLFASVIPCGAITQDSGNTWSAFSDGLDIVCAFQDVQQITSRDVVLTGAWLKIDDPSGNGVQLSTNDAKRLENRNWDQGVTNVARYSHFFSKDQGVTVGGEFPTTDDVGMINFKPSPERPRYITERISFDGERMHIDTRRIPRDNQADVGYAAIAAVATDEARTFTNTFNMTGAGFYFNEISCVGSNDCWVVGEGATAELGQQGYVYYSSDGGNTWTMQQQMENWSLVACSMYNSTYGWIGGANTDPNADAKLEGGFWLTTDGSTWTQDTATIKNWLPFDISVPSPQVAYAAGLDTAGYSSLAKYTGNLNN